MMTDKIDKQRIPYVRCWREHVTKVLYSCNNNHREDEKQEKIIRLRERALIITPTVPLPSTCWQALLVGLTSPPVGQIQRLDSLPTVNKLRPIVGY